MLAILWHDWLYVPLLNFLVVLYNGPAMGNLGVAVMYLTVGLRLVLIPFSIISERNSYKYEKLNEYIKVLNKDFKDDPIARKEHIREKLKIQKINPWASVFLLGVQFLILVLLYQVFVGGMNVEKLSVLYQSISRPDVVNLQFFGLNLSTHSLISSAIVAIWLFLQILRSQRQKKELLQKGDVLFRYAFPFSVFLLLANLPSVKAVFILTSMLFSAIVHIFRPLFLGSLKAVKNAVIGTKVEHEHHQ
ncbi:MAG: YidC/Oxa1 family membrane protein insertase [bacterium]|nr:YidC/Oxa1 family membrane protein insertase [bacterium]